MQFIVHMYALTVCAHARESSGTDAAVKGSDAMPKSNFTLRLNDEELEWLRQEAQKQNRSMGNLIRYILRDYKRNHCSSTENDIK